MSDSMVIHPDQALSVPGFAASAVSAGIRKGNRDDISLIYAEHGACGSAVFTQSQVVAAPVIVSREHLQVSPPSCLIINAGNANACTGYEGIELARRTTYDVAVSLGLEKEQVLVGSTGVIGVPLPYELLKVAIPTLVDSLDRSAHAWTRVAHAIMTTDLVAKICSATFVYQGVQYTVTGVAKGSGMIRPNMATMISCLVTDAPLAQHECESLVHEVADATFNRVTVDGDTSTNDTLVLMASGLALGNSSDDGLYELAQKALLAVGTHLARAVARDGEGATKLVAVQVSGAPTEREAEQVAFTIAESPLVKTALFGNDANWGRVAGAAGRAGVVFDQNKLSITFAGIEVCHNGTALAFDEDEAFQALNQPEVTIVVNLGGDQEISATVWTCDLSYEYVRINGEYRS